MPFKSVKTSGDSADKFNLLALVQFGKETARFDFKQFTTNDEKKDARNAQWFGQSIRIDNENLPQIYQNIKPGTIVDQVFVYLDVKTKKVIAINPWEGTFEAICYELGSTNAGRDEQNRPLFDYVPKEESGYNNDTRKFFAAYEITGDTEFAGIFKGCKPRYHLQHKWVEAQDGLAGVEGNAYYKGKQTQTGKLVEWCEAHEVDQDMQWPADGNCLPEIEQRILSVNKPVRLTIDKGWITKVSKARGAAVRVVEEEEPATQPGLTDSTFGNA